MKCPYLLRTGGRTILECCFQQAMASCSGMHWSAEQGQAIPFDAKRQRRLTKSLLLERRTGGAEGGLPCAQAPTAASATAAPPWQRLVTAWCLICPRLLPSGSTSEAGRVTSWWGLPCGTCTQGADGHDMKAHDDCCTIFPER